MLERLFKIEKNESKLERVKRKMYEETGLELLDVNPIVIAKYKFKVNTHKNASLSDEDVICKLNRDFYSANITNKDNEKVISKQYGCLRITYNKIENRISSIWNDHDCKPFRVDELLLNRLNDIMELE